MRVVADDEPRGPDERQDGDGPEVAGGARLHLGLRCEGERNGDGEAEQNEGRAAVMGFTAPAC